MNRDLTTGKPETVIWKFCLPLFGSVIFQQLYNIADSLIAGRFIGEKALAAVGNSYEITLIFIAIAFGCNIGCSVVVSRYFGAKDFDNVKTTVFTSAIAGIVTCLVMMIPGIILSEKLLFLINTPVEILSDSLLYLNIYIWGLPFLFFYNIATGIFSAMGDSKTPFIFLAASSTANVGLDILFVATFNMGVAGVAWATFICQGISCVLAVIVVYIKMSKLPSVNKLRLFSFEILKKITRIAVPSMLQQSFISIGNIIIQGVINGFGSGVIAGYAAGVKLNNLVITSFTTIGNGISNYTSQNLGAGKTERVKEGFKGGIKMIWSLTVVFSLIYFFMGKHLLGLFLENPTPDALNTGIIYLRILAPFYFVVSAKLVADGILRGSGLMGSFMISTFTDLILRVGLAVIFSATVLGSVGIWCAWPIGWTFGAVISILFTIRCFKLPLGSGENHKLV